MKYLGNKYLRWVLIGAGLSLILLLGCCGLPGNNQPLTDQEIVNKYYGRLATVTTDEKGQIVILGCPKPRSDSPLRFITFLYPKTCTVRNPFPPEIGQLTTLKNLGISGSPRLTAIPPEIGHLTSLEILYLRQNNLATLPRRLDN